MKILKVRYMIGKIEVGRYSIKVINKQLAEICRFAISEQLRGKGHGKAMLLAAVERCPVPLIIATVRYDNTKWWRCNIECGFKLVDRIYKPTGDVLVFLRNKSASYPR